jgi:DNA polymerase-3 subunit beta
MVVWCNFLVHVRPGSKQQGQANSVKITVQVGALVPALKRAASIVERRNTIPILAHVLITPDETGTFSVTTTDMEKLFTETVEGSVTAGATQGGGCTADARRLLAVLGGASGEVTLAYSGGDAPLRVTTEDFEANLTTLPAEDFPTMNEPKGTRSWAWELDALRDTLRFILPAISSEETRYYLNGIYVHQQDDKPGLHFCATDGHRLHLAPAPDAIRLRLGASNSGLGVILPKATLKPLLAFLGREAGELEVELLGDTKMRFRHGRWSLLTKLIDGTFPLYDRVIPKFDQGLIDVLTIHAPDRLRAFLRRVASISTERSRPVKLTTETEKGNKHLRLVLETASPDAGRARLTVPAAVATMEAAMPSRGVSERGFQARYVEEALMHLAGAPEWKFQEGRGDSPAIITAGDRMVVLMPMRV